MAEGTRLDAPIVAVTVLGERGAAGAALARAVSFGRAGHDDLAQMAGHLSADTASALGRRREISARRRAARRELWREGKPRR
jgi:hypothetical protein